MCRIVRGETGPRGHYVRRRLARWRGRIVHDVSHALHSDQSNGFRKQLPASPFQATLVHVFATEALAFRYLGRWRWPGCNYLECKHGVGSRRRLQILTQTHARNTFTQKSSHVNLGKLYSSLTGRIESSYNVSFGLYAIDFRFRVHGACDDPVAAEAPETLFPRRMCFVLLEISRRSTTTARFGGKRCQFHKPVAT